MKKVLKSSFIILSFLLILSKGWATHIVGGEFEIIHLKDFDYQLNLVQYFDVVNGNPFAEDSAVVAFIFRKTDNQFIRSVKLLRVDRELVGYTQPQCAIGSLVTRKILYSADLTLSPDIYGHPEGYYVVFERCCRNNVISNIFLSAPNTVGQTFYLEFPPVIKNGTPFINSSPILFQPLGDFACVGQLYYFDFSGVDTDGDSLVYSMSNPLNSSSVIALPIPSPAPHPVVPWNPGININNQIPGAPPLNTTPEGFLTVSPSSAGLYAFALKAEEYRDGVKIGEVRRDFQMLVIDCGPPQFPPEIRVRKKGDLSFHNPNQVLSFDMDDEKCFELVVTDPNTQEEFNSSETITISALPINFEEDLSGIFATGNIGFINIVNDTLVVEICLPDCPYLEDEPFRIEFTAQDNTCPLPLVDTVLLTIDIEPPLNTDPFYLNTGKLLRDTLEEGDLFELILLGQDNDLDLLEITIVPDSFNLAKFDMKLEDQLNQPGLIASKFSWDTNCKTNQFGLSADYRLFLVLDDLDECGFGDPDTITVDIHMILPTNTDPVVTTSLNSLLNLEGEIDLQVEIFELIEFNVTATDADNDQVMLTAVGDGFDMAELGINFEPSEGMGSTSSPFSWNIICGLFDVNQMNEFVVHFIGTDSDQCKIPNADTLSVNFHIAQPPNNFPQLSLGQDQSPVMEILAGKTVRLDLIGVDQDNDSLILELLSFSSLLTRNDFVFEPVEGIGSVSSNFEWVTNCSHRPDIGPTNLFEFVFLLTDNYCAANQSDTLRLEIFINDQDVTFEDFVPANVFTPNGDGKNDVFFIPNLPVDNCEMQLESIMIFNRWGRLMFSDTKSDFVWDGFGASPGVYYYKITYTNDLEFKGLVSIIL